MVAAAAYEASVAAAEEDVPSIGGFSEFGIMDLLESYRVGNREARKITLPDGREIDMFRMSPRVGWTVVSDRDAAQISALP